MPDPAATFNGTYAQNAARLAQRSGWGSPLYLIHKDITKTLESPNSINEVIDGNETEAQYSVILDVPAGARGFIPFIVLNAVVSASNAYPSEFKVTATVASGTNPLRYFFMGRAPMVSSEYTYNPYSAGMTNAVDPGFYGYWHGLGAWRLATSTSGVDNFVAYADANNLSATPSGYSLPVSNGAGTARTYIANLLLGRTAGVGFENTQAISNYPITSNLLIQPSFTDGTGIIPLHGCDKITCIATQGSSAPTIVVGANMGSGTLTSVNAGLAVRFVS